MMMQELYVDVAHCPIGGESVTTRPDGSWSRDTIRLKFGRTRMLLRQTPEGMPTRHSVIKGTTAHTTIIEFGRVPRDRVSFLRGVAEDVSWLLSLATLSPVTPFRYRQGGASWGPTVGSDKTVVFRPLIEARNGAAVRGFLEGTWPAFRRLKRKRKLPAVLHYLVLGEQPEIPLEVRMLLSLTALEALKHGHSPQQRHNFERRVVNMLRDVGMRRGIKRLVWARNDIVHEGLAGIPRKSLRRHYDTLRDILHEYLLRLLGYRGPYLLYSSAARSVRTM